MKENSYITQAINNRDLPQVKSYLLQRCSERTESSDPGFDSISFLQLLILYSGEELALYGLESGLDPHQKTDLGISSLHLAIMCNYQLLAKALIGKGVDVHSRDYANATAVNHALDYTRTLPLAQELLQDETVLNSANPFYLYDSYKQLRAPSLKPYADRVISKSPHLHEQWREYYLIKLCAHLFEVDQVTTLTPLKGSGESLEFYREGLLAPMKILHKVAKHTEAVGYIFDNGMHEIIAESLFFTSEETVRSDAEYLERIQSDKPTLIFSGSFAHCRFFLFYQDRFAFCDSCFISPTFYTYDRSKLTENIIHQFRAKPAYTDSQDIVEKFIQPIYGMLEAKASPPVGYVLNWVNGRKGHCTWKSIELAVMACLSFYGSELDQKSMTQQLSEWKLSLRLYYADAYLYRHEKGGAGGFFSTGQVEYELDYFLLENMKKVLDSEKTTHHDHVSRLVSIRERISELLRPTEHRLITRGNNLDMCFSHFLTTQAPKTKNSYTYQTVLQTRQAHKI